MKGLQIFSMIVLSGLLVCGCSGDDGNGAPGSDAAGDGPAQSDGGGPGADGGGKPDAGQDGALEPGLSCAALSLCQGCCPEQDEACKTACEEAMSAEGQQAWDAQMSCITTTCGDPCKGEKALCEECINTKCADQRKACSWGSGGSGKCMDGWTCAAGCPALVTDGSGTAGTCPSSPGLVCLQKCLSTLTPAAVDLVTVLGPCSYENCAACRAPANAAECTTCQETQCGPEFKACKEDK